jgi:hypothetical protein
MTVGVPALALKCKETRWREEKAGREIKTIKEHVPRP